jgi:hypothetical protein
VTGWFLQTKERVPMKNSSSAGGLSESSRSESPVSPLYKHLPSSSQLPLSSVGSSSVASSKSGGGRFTTANFIETTIVPSPANFGTVSSDQKSSAADNSAMRSLTSASASSTDQVVRSTTPGVSTQSAATGTVGGSVTSSAPSISTSPQTATSSASSNFSQTFKNFGGQNYDASDHMEASPPQQSNELQPPTSPIEVARSKRRLPKCVPSAMYLYALSLTLTRLAVTYALAFLSAVLA